MIKNLRRLILILAPILLLSGCSLIPGQSKTEIVFQEKKQINDLQEFAQEAQKIAVDEIGQDVKLKRVNFSYPATGDYISYNAYFQGDGTFSNGATKHLFVSYNQKYEKTDKIDLAWSFADRDVSPNNNGELIGMECNSSKDCNLMAFYPDIGDDINIEDLKISVSDLVKKYPVELETGSDRLGMIFVAKGVLKGIYGHYRFKPATGEVALVENINESQWFSSDVKTDNPVSENNVFSTTATIANTSAVDILTLNFNNDSDEDGLTNLQETGYGTRPDVIDTDSDGHPDNEEISNGYNPLGSGKLISDDCLKNQETDKCYLEMAKAKKDISLCQKVSIKNEALKCLLQVNLIIKNPQICEDLSKVPGNDMSDFYSTCLKELVSTANLAVSTLDRDAVTLSNVKIIQVALELYYNEIGKYPETIITGSPIVINGNTFLAKVPAAKKGETDACAIDFEYKYTYINNKDYTLNYCLDHKTSHVPAGAHVASPEGIY